MNDGNVITISNLIEHGLNDFTNYRNLLLISTVRDLSLFRCPCHVKAITILVCVSGEMEVCINLRRLVVRQGMVVISLPESNLQILRVKDLEAYALLVSADYMTTLTIGYKNRKHCYAYDVFCNAAFTLPSAEMEHLTQCLHSFRHAVASPLFSANEELICHLTSSMLICVMVLHQAYHVDTSRASQGKSQSCYLLLDRFIELVITYHSRERELRFYADKLCITPKYLSSVIRKTSGKKATDWICELVILEAKSLLKHSGMNIQQIARHLNFPSQSAFGKYFKCQVGITPSEFQMGSHG